MHSKRARVITSTPSAKTFLEEKTQFCYEESFATSSNHIAQKKKSVFLMEDTGEPSFTQSAPRGSFPEKFTREVFRIFFPLLPLAF